MPLSTVIFGFYACYFTYFVFNFAIFNNSTRKHCRAVKLSCMLAAFQKSTQSAVRL